MPMNLGPGHTLIRFILIIHPQSEYRIPVFEGHLHKKKLCLTKGHQLPILTIDSFTDVK